jgi:uncharacterized membrane protein YfcA
MAAVSAAAVAIVSLGAFVGALPAGAAGFAFAMAAAAIWLHAIDPVRSALPALALGGWLGWRLYGKLEDAQFRRLLAALIAASGAALLA